MPGEGPGHRPGAAGSAEPLAPRGRLGLYAARLLPSPGYGKVMSVAGGFQPWKLLQARQMPKAWLAVVSVPAALIAAPIEPTAGTPR